MLLQAPVTHPNYPIPQQM
ncbi:hypothetical protein CVT26_015922 [Gymnopilus dilepis]|uniref:Uncharacterized protein n=1 Tax=Gymnopilus dilepis TaxID=231916 RepID=A0A409XYD6_9AGAR|nr:hypothetical protein CVT26_015922 [Gymnopilus dilepis]